MQHEDLGDKKAFNVSTKYTLLINPLIYIELNCSPRLYIAISGLDVVCNFIKQSKVS